MTQEDHHRADTGPVVREYVGFIWIGADPGVRLRVLAESAEDAQAEVIAEYGEGHVMSLWNEEDASKKR